MIILITYENKDKNGRWETLVSHGVDEDTMESICLPPEPPSQMGYFHQGINEWVLSE